MLMLGASVNGMGPTEAGATGADVPEVRTDEAYFGGAEYGALPVELPLSIAQTQLVVEGVQVNGAGPFRFLLDTGAMGAGRIDASLVARLGLVPSGEAQATDGSGRLGPTLKEYRLATLQLGPVTWKDVRMISRDYNQHGAEVRGHIAGVLGFHLFRDLLMTIDYPGRVLRLDSGALPAPDGQTLIPLLDLESVPTVTIDLAGQSVSARIDTGSMGAISIDADLAVALPLAGEPRKIGEARTVTGAFAISSVKLGGNAQIGAHVLHQPELVIGVPSPAVNLGGRVLQQFALTFDQRNARLRITRGAAAAPSGSTKRYGILLAMQPGAPMLVDGVESGSIAERAGLQAGDRIIQLNGQPVDELNMAARAAALRGSPVTLLVERTGREIELTLSLDDPAQIEAPQGSP